MVNKGRESMAENTVILELTTEIAASYVSGNNVPAVDLPALINRIHRALLDSEKGKEVLKPAVPIKQSVKPGYIVCLEDGKKLKMLKNHLRASYNLNPGEYRKKWGLPSDYPMTAPSYSRQRSALAKKFGFGTKSRGRPIPRGQ